MSIPPTMKAQLFYGPKDVRFEETQIPQIGPGEALVKIKRIYVPA